MLTLLLAALGSIVVVGALALVRQLLHPPRKTYAVALARQLPTDPAVLGRAFTERQFELPDGTSAPGWDICGDDDDGPVVVFTHGWGDSRFGALTWVDVIAPAASGVVVYDVRGHGDSPCPITRLGTTEVWDLLAVMDRIDEDPASGRAPDRPIVLMGHSLGAGVAIAAAALDARHESERVAGVVADGACRTFTEPVSGMLRSRHLPPLAFVPLARLVLAARIGGLRGFDRAGHAADLHCPMLMLHGSADPICSLGTARRLAAAARDARLEVFEGGGHGDLAQVDEARYRAVLASFLRGARHVARDGDQYGAASADNGEGE